MKDGKATYSARLVTGQTYDFVFWAYNEEGDFYTVDTDTKTVTVNYEGKCNDEARDAFYKYNKDVKITGPLTETVTLYRPFAQLNYGVNKEDIDAAAAAGIVVKNSAVTVKAVPTILNLTDGSATGSADVTFAAAACPTEDLVVKEVAYGYVAMNYILAGKGEKINVETELALYGDDTNTAIDTKIVPAVPLQGNWRTNILGNLFTTDVNFNIVVEPAFENDNVIDLENINTVSALAALMLNGGSAVLADDITIDSVQELVIPEGKSVTLDLNGHNITNTEDIWFDSKDENVPSRVALVNVSGELTVKGAGVIKAKENDCYTFNVKNGGHLVIEDGEYVGNISVIQVQEGLAEVKGGHFDLAQTWPSVGNGYEYTINLIDAARNDGTAKAVVTGGTFVGFNPANNLAEGANTNFCAEGYTSLKVSSDPETYTVVSDAELKANAASLRSELARGGADNDFQ